MRVAWRHLASEVESSVGAALALLLALLPAGLVLVNGSAARVDLRTVIAASGPIEVQRAGVRTPLNSGDAQAFDDFQGQVRARVGPRLGQYVDGGSGRGTASPFRIATIATRPPSTQASTGDLSITYVDDLANRVDVVQGLLPKPGTTGGEHTASMPIAVADRAGIQLFDSICVGVPTGGGPVASSWCARVTALWRPTATSDPRWTAPDAPVELFTDRDDLFSLVSVQPAPTFSASRLYRTRPGAIAPQDAGTVAAGVREVRAGLANAGIGRLDTALDRNLERYSGSSVVSFPVELLAAALVPLLTLLAVVTARWYVEPRLQELALLRARGWSRGRVEHLVLTQLAMLSVPAVAVALVGALVLALQAEGGSLTAPALRLSAGEVLAVAVAAFVLVVAGIRYVGLARWASRQSVLRVDRDESRAPRLLSWRGADASGLLVLPAALLLLLPRLLGGGQFRLPGIPDDLGALALSVIGLVMLVLAALPAMSLAAGWHGRRRRDGLEGTLANWQLRRWWQRNGPAGFLVVFAFASASFAGVALTSQVMTGSGSAIGRGIAASLAIGFVSSLVTALLAYGLVFLVTCRSRVDHYASLLVDGLPADTVRRSVEIEQHAVLIDGLVAGVAIGLVLVLATASGIAQPGVIASAPPPAAIAIGLIVTAAAGLLAGRLVGRLVRSHVVGFRLVERGWRVT